MPTALYFFFPRTDSKVWRLSTCSSLCEQRSSVLSYPKKPHYPSRPIKSVAMLAFLRGCRQLTHHRIELGPVTALTLRYELPAHLSISARLGRFSSTSYHSPPQQMDAWFILTVRYLAVKGDDLSP